MTAAHEDGDMSKFSTKDLMEMASKQAVSSAASYACNCIGPQKGQPLCPCQMRGVMVKDGRYVRPEQDLGPVLEK